MFSGSISQSWAFGDTLSIALTAPFTYNSAAGNLLMDVMVSGSSRSGAPIFFNSNGLTSNNNYLGRVITPGNVLAGYALETGFSTTTATPEPGFYGLLALGLGSLATVVIRRKNVKA